VIVGISPIFEMWLAKKGQGVLPEAGGWLDQALHLLICFSMLDYVDWMWRSFREDGMKKLSRHDLILQSSLEQWL